MKASPRRRNAKKSKSAVQRRVKAIPKRKSFHPRPTVTEPAGTIINDVIVHAPFTQRDIKRVERMAFMGMDQHQIATIFDIHWSSVQGALNSSPELARSYKKGQALGIEFVTGKLAGLIRQNNIAAVIFFLKTKARWSEKIALEVIPPGLGEDGEVPPWLANIFNDPRVAEQTQRLAAMIEEQSRGVKKSDVVATIEKSQEIVKSNGSTPH